MARVRWAQLCRRRRTNGTRCAAFAIAGGFVCTAHGGRAPHVRRAANMRLFLASVRREELAAAIALQADLAALVRESVEEMQQTMSINGVAAALGVTRQRVQQMLKAPRSQEPAAG